MRHRRVVRADRRQRALRRADRRAARPVGRRRPGQDRAGRRATSRPRATSTTSTSRATRSHPGCDYEQWGRRITQGTKPTVYAHVATDPGHPGQARAAVLVLLRLQRLEQHARGRLGDDPARLRRGDARPRRCRPSRRPIGYSQHEGAERAAWDDHKLHARRRHASRSSTRPPARTRTSTTSALYLGRSALGGRRLRRHARADVRAPARSSTTIPSDPARRARRSPGSPSPAAGASCSARSSTARPGPNLKT